MLQKKQRRRRYIFLVVPVLPAVFFMVVGGTYMSYARHLYGQMRSTDCTVSAEPADKFWLQEAYTQARAAHRRCLSRMKEDNLGAPLRHHPTLQSCEEWSELVEGQQTLVPWQGYRLAANP